MLRKLRRLESEHTDINTWMLESFGYCTYELIIPPFFNLTPRNPPGWYFREYVESLHRVALNWRFKLEENYEKYYLAVWLFSPRESKTQLVAAIGDRIEYYKNLFRKKEGGASFPQSIRQTENESEWKPHWDYEPFWKGEGDLDDNDFSWLKKKSAHEEKVGGETRYLIPKGTVWVNDKFPRTHDASDDFDKCRV